MTDHPLDVTAEPGRQHWTYADARWLHPKDRARLALRAIKASLVGAVGLSQLAVIAAAKTDRVSKAKAMASHTRHMSSVMLDVLAGRESQAAEVGTIATHPAPSLRHGGALVTRREPEPLSLRESEARIIGKPGPVRFHGDGAVIFRR